MRNGESPVSKYTPLFTAAAVVDERAGREERTDDERDERVGRSEREFREMKMWERVGEKKREKRVGATRKRGHRGKKQLLFRIEKKERRKGEEGQITMDERDEGFIPMKK
uniref:Uncharacterized protein n=1 Tax=Pristionchus pacificus TaxID=54126 RepID=A0A2A6BQP6_PRIPA|eukprot:PDM68215.1 hypothetical protein PRIPAC_46259 [Pristionchus pacificus]